MLQNIKKVFIAGHNGLVGSALYRLLMTKSNYSIITKKHSELDLTNEQEVNKFFKEYKPKIVYISAAKVGGIKANNDYPVDFLLTNLKIQNNLIEACFNYKVEKLLFLGSSCIYPKFAPQPIKEEYLLSSTLEPSNEPYALAKISGIKLCEAFNKQYNTNYLSVMPCNLYGINDNYDKNNAHVIPMLIRKMHEAKMNRQTSVEIWGDGTPLREFLFSDDLAEACVFLMENYNAKDLNGFLNIGSGIEISIKELCEIIKSIVEFNGELIFNNQLNGTPRKLIDSSKINSLGWKPKTNFIDGIKISYKDFLENKAKL